MTAIAGKTCVITGATSGIGLATAERLVLAGARLVLVGRDSTKGEAALARLKSLRADADLSILYADLAHFAAVQRLAQGLARTAPRIDVLINNAGAVFSRRDVTEDGLERTFALNHMAYFMLTLLLKDQLAAAAPARIVNVASSAHRTARLDLADLRFARGYDGWTAYRRSKLCNILFTRELARRLAGSGITANSLHPGFVASRFGDNTSGAFRLGLSIAKRVAAISPARGAETSFHLAAAPEVDGVTGRYFDRCRAIAPSAAAQDDMMARQLWDQSAQLAAAFLPPDVAAVR